MNPRQKSYDSYDKTNKLLKLTNSFYHFRNLELIKKRKPHYGNCPTLYQKNSNYLSPFQNHFVQKQNENIQNKLNQIRWRPIKPKINETFLVKESKIQAFRKQHKNISLKIRDEENEKYKRRIKNQKAFINPKLMDKDFKEGHTKTLMKLKKIADNDNIVLPSIKNSYNNPTLMESKKYYYNTESSIRNAYDTSKRIRTGDEDKSFNGSRYASGTNSVDK